MQRRTGGSIDPPVLFFDFLKANLAAGRAFPLAVFVKASFFFAHRLSTAGAGHTSRAVGAVREPPLHKKKKKLT